jgi:large subunit ribosomal protein L10
MRKEEKRAIIDSIAENLKTSPNFYVTDISGLNAKKTYELRKMCFERKVKLMVVKNTLLQKALEQIEFAEADLFSTLKGSSAVMFTEVANVPAKLIKEFRKKDEKPAIKSAYVQECLFIGDRVDELANIKSREELIGDIIGLLQSPAKNVISALQLAGQTISGLIKTLSERPE